MKMSMNSSPGVMKHKKSAQTIITTKGPDHQEHKGGTKDRLKGSATDLSHSLSGASAVQSNR